MLDDNGCLVSVAAIVRSGGCSDVNTLVLLPGLDLVDASFINVFPSRLLWLCANLEGPNVTGNISLFCKRDNVLTSGVVDDQIAHACFVFSLRNGVFILVEHESDKLVRGDVLVHPKSGVFN